MYYVTATFALMDYPDIKAHCEATTELSRSVIDDYLIYYAAAREGLEPKMEAQLKKYRKAARNIPASYINYLKSEYIAHQVFRKSGFITKYLDLPAIRSLPTAQYEFLAYQASHPWRFSFAEIINKPAEAFFTMLDLMTGDSYLLYSPGMLATENEYHPRSWFLLITFNGQCWQTFGLIIPFRGFQADDLFFFATELNPGITDEGDLMQEVDRNPFPFFLLLAFANIPQIVTRGYPSLIHQSADILTSFSTVDLAADFSLSWHKDVYRLASRTHGEFPHYAVAYFQEKKRELLRTAMTETGFAHLTGLLARAGFPMHPEADLVVSPSMLSAAEKILDKTILLNPYEKLFLTNKKEENEEPLNRINHFLALALPYYNEKTEPDLRELAGESGISLEMAVELWEKVMGGLERPGTDS
ncbi:MAG TPA: hypothetical protein VG870_14360 [Chitinophagaceae bacterium]|nr:hypothetical protein [Chitinophagaceae bacterium]